MDRIHTSANSGGSSVAPDGGQKDVTRVDEAVPVATMNCDRVARFYRPLEYLSFGGALQACRVMYVREVADCSRALVCGDGDGRFLAELLRANRHVCVDFVDLSSAMVRLARRRVESIDSQASGRARFHVGDVREFSARDGAPYDLITAHFFLDCFGDREVAEVAGKLASVARCGASLLLSDFRIPADGVGRYVDAAIVRGLYGAFRITTGLRVTHLPNYEGALERAGFCKQKETIRLGGLLVGSLWKRI